MKRFAMVLAATTLLVAACKKEEKAPETPKPAAANKPAAKEPAKPAAKKEPAKPAAAAAGIKGAFDSVIADCGTVSNSGTPFKCKDKGAYKKLSAAEKADGLKKTTDFYAAELNGTEEKRRKLAAGRLSWTLTFERDAKAVASEKLYETLKKHVKDASLKWAPVIAKPFVRVGGALNKKDDIIATAKALPDGRTKQAVYERLWYVGDKAYLPTLKEALASKDADLRKSVLRGFESRSFKVDAEVCGLIVKHTKDADAKVAGQATWTHSFVCRKDAPKTLAAAGYALGKKRFTMRHAMALGSLARRKDTPAKLKKKISKVLAKAVSDAKAAKGFGVRSAALRSLKDADMAAAKKLAAKYTSDKDFALRSEAKRILK